MGKSMKLSDAEVRLVEAYRKTGPSRFGECEWIREGLDEMVALVLDDGHDTLRLAEAMMRAWALASPTEWDAHDTPRVLALAATLMKGWAPYLKAMRSWPGVTFELPPEADHEAAAGTIHATGDRYVMDVTHLVKHAGKGAQMVLAAQALARMEDSIGVCKTLLTGIDQLGEVRRVVALFWRALAPHRDLLDRVRSIPAAA